MKLAQKLLPFATPPVSVSSKRHSCPPPFNFIFFSLFILNYVLCSKKWNCCFKVFLNHNADFGSGQVMRILTGYSLLMWIQNTVFRKEKKPIRSNGDDFHAYYRIVTVPGIPSKHFGQRSYTVTSKFSDVIQRWPIMLMPRHFYLYVKSICPTARSKEE